MSLVALVVAVLAGGIAALLRWGVSVAFAGRSLPWAVLAVNVAGSAIGGAALGLAVAGSIDRDIRLVLLSGIAGGLSTFSTWSVETIDLVHAGRWRVAAASVTANLALGLGAAVGGYALALAVV